MCYSFDSYCDRRERDVASCFPYYLRDEKSKLRRWCRHVLEGKESLLDPQCKFACDFRFNSLQSSEGDMVTPSQVSVANRSNFLQISAESNVTSTHNSTTECFSDATLPWTIAGICGLLLVVSLIVNIIFLLSHYSRRASYTPLEVEKKNKLKLEMQDAPEDSSKESLWDQDQAVKRPGLNLKRQRSFHQEEKLLEGPSVVQLHAQNQRTSLGVIVRNSYSETEGDNQPGEKDQDALSAAEDDRCSRGSSLDGGRSRSSSIISIPVCEGEQLQENFDSDASSMFYETDEEEAEEKGRRHRRHHIIESDNQHSGQGSQLMVTQYYME